MGDNKLRPFAYAHSTAVMRALTIGAKNRGHFISGGYDFLEEAGAHTAFDKMITLAKEIGVTNPLYIDTVKELAGHSLADFKNALTAIEVLEALEPGYVKNREKIVAVTMSKLNVEMEDICKETGLNESDVFQAVAEYKREQEQNQQQDT